MSLPRPLLALPLVLAAACLTPPQDNSSTTGSPAASSGTAAGPTATTGSHPTSTVTTATSTSGSSTIQSDATATTGTSGTTGTACYAEGANGGTNGGSCSSETVTTCADQKVICNGAACVCSQDGMTVGMVTTPTDGDCSDGFNDCFGTTGTTGFYMSSASSGATSSGTIEGASGGPGSTSGTTGSAVCCQTNSDCAQYGAGAVCTNGACYVMDEGIGTVGATTCGGGSTSAGPSATTGTSGTTSSSGNEGFGCGCNTDSDCNGPNWSGLSCISGVCQFDPDAAAATSSTGGCYGSSTGTTGTTGQGSSTPLVFVFDSQPVTYSYAAGTFELAHVGSGLRTDWPSAHTPWLALDRDGNGSIDDGRELFGSMTELGQGRVADNGFAALAALDSNHDGVIDSRDRDFARLRVWTDRDQDRRSTPAELTSLTEAGIVSISLDYRSAPICDARGNCEVERAPFTWRDAYGQLRAGDVVDVHLANRAIETAVARR